MTEFEEVLEIILEEYARRNKEGDFDTWEETDSFVKEKAEVLLAYANLKGDPVSKRLEKETLHGKRCSKCGDIMKADTSVVYTSIPPMYMYHCPKCGNNEFGLCSENY